MAPAGLGHAGPEEGHGQQQQQLPEEYKEEISPASIITRSHSHAIIRRTSRSGLSITSMDEEEPSPEADPAQPSNWRHLADRVMRRSRSQGEPIAGLGANDDDPADSSVVSKPESSLGSFLEAYNAKQQQQQQQQQKQQQQQLRSGLVTPATVPVTEPTSPQAILGPDGREIVPGMRRKKSVTERAQKATWRCAHLIKILLCLAAAATVFYFITEIEGIRMIDVSVIPLPFGEVRGKITKDYQEYLGVPFALPPKRFGLPHLWEGRYPNGFLDATIPAEPCAQIAGNRVFGSEDCLRLNIFSPAPSASLPAATGDAHGEGHDAGAHAEAGPAGGGQHRRSLLRGRRLSGGGGEAESGHEVIVPPRPVMVYFHGGGFAAGSADEVDGRRLAADNNVVVVSVPYRLGALGFLAHPDMLKEDVSKETREGIGNLGLLDQRAALLWIQDHIQAFNGDPARVTVFGHGAGATSACLQAVLPPGEQGGESKRRLTQAAIVESGACYAQHLDMALKRGEEFAAAANCSTLACLEALPLPDLLRASRDVSAPRFRFWQPVVDGQVVPLPANLLLAQSQEGLAALITGDNADEGDNFARSALQHAHEADEDYVSYVKGPMRAMEGLELLTDAEIEEMLTLYPPAGSRAAGLAAEQLQQQEQQHGHQGAHHQPEEPLHAEPAAVPAAVKVGGDAQMPEQQQREKEGGNASPTARLTGNRLNIARIMSDAHYYCPTLAAARALPNQDRAFVYSFRYAPQPCPGRTSAAQTPLATYKGGDRESAESYGCTPAAYDTGLRGTEVPFVFHDRVRGDCRRTFTDEEDLLAEEMEGYWTNLARSTITPNADPNSAAAAQHQPQPHAVPLAPIAGPGTESPAIHGEEQPHVIVAMPPAPGPAHRALRSLGELFSRRKEAKEEEEGGAAWEHHRSSQDGAVPLSFWPALGQGEKVLVFEDGGVAIRPPERLAFCAFWDRTKVYTG